MRTEDAMGGAVRPEVDVAELSIGILDALPVAMFLVDHDLQIGWANELARQSVNTDGVYVELLRAGDALRCAQAAQATACGEGPACDRCEVRRAVLHAFATRQTVRSRARVRRAPPAAARDLHLLITTQPLPASPEHVLLALQDISELVQLQGLIPICANCKSVRDDQRYWQSVEQYLRDRLDAQFSHGLCPDCVRELYADEPNVSGA